MPQLIQAMQCGALPVLVGRQPVFPFAAHTPSASFVYHVGVTALGSGRVVKLLSAIPHADIVTRRHTMAAHLSKLLYMRQHASFARAGPSAFDMVLRSVADRLSVSRGARFAIGARGYSTPPGLRVEPWPQFQPDRPRMALYRVLGNAQPPRHAADQLLQNLRFVLDHEPALPGTDRRFILNRIINRTELRLAKAMLDEAGLPFTVVPFHETAWTDACKAEYVSAAVYMSNVNGARNLAIDEASALGYDWVFPFDGNHFEFQDRWVKVLAAAARSRPGGCDAMLVQMFRVNGSNTQLLVNGGASLWLTDAQLEEEEQVGVRTHPPKELRFLEGRGWGMSDKLALIASLQGAERTCGRPAYTVRLSDGVPEALAGWKIRHRLRAQARGACRARISTNAVAMFTADGPTRDRERMWALQTGGCVLRRVSSEWNDLYLEPLERAVRSGVMSARWMVSHDVVMGVAIGYTTTVCLPFLRSLRLHYRGRVVLYAGDTKPGSDGYTWEDMAREFDLELHSVELEAADVDAMREAGLGDPMPTAKLVRYQLLHLVAQRMNPAGLLMITDIRDVVVQDNPMQRLARAMAAQSADVSLFGESVLIRNQRSNLHWLRTCFPPADVAHIEHNHVICSGINFGSRAGMLELSWHGARVLGLARVWCQDPLPP